MYTCHRSLPIKAKTSVSQYVSHKSISLIPIYNLSGPSSDLSRINFCNNNFIVEPSFSDEVNDEYFRLEDVAKHYGIKNNSNEAAEKSFRE